MATSRSRIIDFIVICLAVLIVVIGLRLIKAQVSKQVAELEAAQAELRAANKALDAEIKKRDAEIAASTAAVIKLTADLDKAKRQTAEAQAALNYVKDSYEKKTTTELTAELTTAGVEVTYSPALGLYTLPEPSARTLALSFFELKALRPAYEAVVAESEKKDQLITELNRLASASASEITALKERLNREAALSASLSSEVALLKRQSSKNKQWAYLALAGMGLALGAAIAK
jgi:septal ring factor EnvC (AmiA/AmiB activator)